MAIDRARPLHSIYDDVADHDLVIVPDNPLADALNRRVTEPRFGTVATTPRRLATGRRETAEDRIAFQAVIDRTDLPWKAVAHAVGDVLQCWEHQGSVDDVLAYDAHVDDATREVVAVMRDLPTTSRRLADYEVDADCDVAVVGVEQLTDLERSVVPADADSVDLFAGEAFDPPPFHVFERPRDVVDAVLDTVSTETADDVAVVLDAGSQYSSLVESALAAADVPYYGGPGFVDDPDHRAFLALLRTAFRGSGTTVGDVRPLCTRLGIDVPVEHDRKRLDAIDVPGLEWVANFCATAGGRTFDSALAGYEVKSGRSLSAFREELEDLGLADVELSRGRVADLEYYLQRYEVPVERDNEGVLLADAKSAAYVDRPAVFHLGMGEGWTHAAPQRPWVDAEAQFDRSLRNFQLLLQNGTNQYYLVQDTAGGQPVTPCLYFGELLETDYDRFSDLDSVSHIRHAGADGGGFGREPLGVDAASIDAISQSSLNSYANSPRDYFFGRLLDSSDRDYFREGNLFHDFAEFAVAHPDRVDDAIDEVVDLMVAEAGSFFQDLEEPLRRRKYRVGLETIAAYLDAVVPEDDGFLTPASGWGRNEVAAHFDQTVDTPLTERWFENVAVGAKGKIDLVAAPDHLVDFKSGRHRSARTVVRNAAVDPPADAPNFQAALYLSHFRAVTPDERLEFTFFHFLEPLADVVAGDLDLAALRAGVDDGDEDHDSSDDADDRTEAVEAALEDALTTVTYYPEPFAEWVASREPYDVLLDGYTDCVETFDDLGYPDYQRIVGELAFPESTDREGLRASEFAAEFTAAVDAATAGDVDAEKGCDQAIRALNGHRKRSFFPGDLDAVESFVADCIAEINDHRAGEGRFPVEGPGGEPNYRRVDHRDLLLGDGDD